MQRRWRTAVALLCLLGIGCAGTDCAPTASPAPSSQGAPEGKARPSDCPGQEPAPAVLPGVRTEHRRLEYWLERTRSWADPDEVVLSAREIEDHNAAFAALGDGSARAHADLAAPISEKRLLAELRERLSYLHERVRSGQYLDADGHRLPTEQVRAFAPPNAPPELAPSLRVTLEPVALRCGPRREGLFRGPTADPAFDRNRCSTIRAQEPVQVLAPASGGMLLARTGYAFGWIAADAPLSPPVPSAWVDAVARGPKLRLRQALELVGEKGMRATVGPGALLPAAPDDERRALFATDKGFGKSQPLGEAQAASTRRALSRRAVLEEAFAYLGTPYGWGGYQQGRDCSRLVMDVLGGFGLRLPRHSGVQALAGSMSIDLGSLEAEPERLGILDAAVRRGIVLLHFRGHIMLYLGRNAEGTPMVLHALGEYVRPCAESATDAEPPPETIMRVERVQVSDLSLGQGSSRRSLFERLTRVVVLGRSPGAELVGAVARRPAAPLSAPLPERCGDGDDVSLFVSPRRPSPAAPTRVVATSSRDLGSVELVLDGPQGARLALPLKRLGGPPFGYWAEVPDVAVGRWTARLGEGSRLEACKRFRVRAEPDQRQAGEGPVWQPRRRWSRAYEQLYAAFVEQLFDYPPEEDRTWRSLGELVGVRDNNLLYNHLGQDEDERLELEPDCADLPYFLRAYFAWKLRLPFGFRKCNRGRPGKLPYCDPEVHDHLGDRDKSDEVKAFEHFARRNVADGVHSGNGRTGPSDERTDYYPLPLERQALAPGTVFADPYGHVLVVADWLPQGIGHYGVLIGADAQPDGTIGRRRFWEGSFLFTPETSEAGAGFKAFRPLVHRGGRLRPVENAAIGSHRGLTPFSLGQYELSTEGFYDRMQQLINPRPLEPRAVLGQLVDALEEAAERRVVSVANAEQHKAAHPGPIDMPHGHSIFETTGAWEDYSTPSRDMRLLIAIDTVTGFAASVRRRPERFGLGRGPGLEQVLADLEQHLEQELAERRFSYQRSDGSSFELSLRDLVARASALEMAYNPNDCVEIRWCAPEGSAERATCQRRAPAEQRARMAEYRDWFARRQRPSR